MSESVWTDGENEHDQLLGCVRLLRDVADSGVEWGPDPRVSYVVVQVDTETWRQVQNFRTRVRDE